MSFGNNEQAHDGLVRIFVAFHESYIAKDSQRFYTRNLELVLRTFDPEIVHEWEGGHCDFHPLKRCSCEKCSGDGAKCSGKPYKTKPPQMPLP